MKSISVSKLSAGSGSSKVIEKGESLIVTDDGNPVAIYRPHESSDKGKKISAGKFYDKVPMCMQEVRQGKMVLVSRRGNLFATLCPYTKKPKVNKDHAKRRPKTAKAVPQPPPPASPEVVQKKLEVTEFVDAIEILSSADAIPQKSRNEFLALGAALSEANKLELGMRMLYVLLDE